MNITSLTLRDIGCFAERSLAFAPGLNLVTGPNESGKSTVAAALYALLYGYRYKGKRAAHHDTTQEAFQAYIHGKRSPHLSAQATREGDGVGFSLERDLKGDDGRCTIHFQDQQYPLQDSDPGLHILGCPAEVFQAFFYLNADNLHAFRDPATVGAYWQDVLHVLYPEHYSDRIKGIILRQKQYLDDGSGSGLLVRQREALECIDAEIGAKRVALLKMRQQKQEVAGLKQRISAIEENLQHYEHQLRIAEAQALSDTVVTFYQLALEQQVFAAISRFAGEESARGLSSADAALVFEAWKELQGIDEQAAVKRRRGRELERLLQEHLQFPAIFRSFGQTPEEAIARLAEIESLARGHTVTIGAHLKSLQELDALLDQERGRLLGIQQKRRAYLDVDEMTAADTAAIEQRFQDAADADAKRAREDAEEARKLAELATASVAIAETRRARDALPVLRLPEGGTAEELQQKLDEFAFCSTHQQRLRVVVAEGTHEESTLREARDLVVVNLRDLGEKNRITAELVDDIVAKEEQIAALTAANAEYKSAAAGLESELLRLQERRTDLLNSIEHVPSYEAGNAIRQRVTLAWQQYGLVRSQLERTSAEAERTGGRCKGYADKLARFPERLKAYSEDAFNHMLDRYEEAVFEKVKLREETRLTADKLKKRKKYKGVMRTVFLCSLVLSAVFLCVFAGVYIKRGSPFYLVCTGGFGAFSLLFSVSYRKFSRPGAIEAELQHLGQEYAHRLREIAGSTKEVHRLLHAAHVSEGQQARNLYQQYVATQSQADLLERRYAELVVEEAALLQQYEDLDAQLGPHLSEPTEKGFQAWQIAIRNDLRLLGEYEKVLSIEADKTKALEALQSKAADAQHRLALLSEELQGLRWDFGCAESAYPAYVDELKAELAIITRLRNEREELEGLLNSLEPRIDALRAELQSFDARAAALVATFDAFCSGLPNRPENPAQAMTEALLQYAEREQHAARLTDLYAESESLVRAALVARVRSLELQAQSERWRWEVVFKTGNADFFGDVAAMAEQFKVRAAQYIMASDQEREAQANFDSLLQRRQLLYRELKDAENQLGQIASELTARTPRLEQPAEALDTLQQLKDELHGYLALSQQFGTVTEELRSIEEAIVRLDRKRSEAERRLHKAFGKRKDLSPPEMLKQALYVGEAALSKERLLLIEAKQRELLQDKPLTAWEQSLYALQKHIAQNRPRMEEVQELAQGASLAKDVPLASEILKQLYDQRVELDALRRTYEQAWNAFSAELEETGNKSLAQCLEERARYEAEERALLSEQEMLDELERTIVNEARAMTAHWQQSLAIAGSGCFRLLTGKARARLLLNHELQVSIEEREGMEAIPFQALSDGAKDQAFLSMRLAAVDFMMRRQSQEPIPIVLDDPFVHYDEQRLQRALLLLTRLSERTQVFYFSNRPEIATLLRGMLGEPALHAIALG